MGRGRLSSSLLWAGISLPLLASCANIPRTETPSSTSAGDSPVFTIPASADQGAPLLPNIEDPQAVNAQKVCPGYTASGIEQNQFGFTATLSLAGEACNVYGTDIETLSLEVSYQAQDRLNVNILPANISPSNQSHYILPDDYVLKPGVDSDETTSESDLDFRWSNEPTFSFSVVRKSTGDVIFSTEGTVLVYENQFIEFVSSLPENYNLYGLGERIHGLRLGNNFTATIYAADIGDPIDENIYGSHPFYLDTRYYEVDQETEELTLVTDEETDPSKGEYVSYSHGVYLRNAHAQEVLLRPETITWRALGGSIDLYFYAGPSQPEVTKSYLATAAGFPAMQQYYTLGFHQARWGYKSWSELEEVVSNFEKFDIPLEALWSDIDYMQQYRDFTHDSETHPYSEGKEFMEKLNAGGRHWVPIVDAAIYIPNPDDPSDAYETYDRGDEAQAFLRNPDGSLYIGAVWPGYTVYTDWLAEGANDWWVNEISLYHEKVGFSGIWLDMNEVASFCVGSCGTGNLTMNPVHPPFQLPGEPGNVIYDYPEGFEVTNATEAASASSASSSQEAGKTDEPSPSTTEYLRTTPTPGVRNVNHPPYVINHVQGDLAVHAVSPNATHADGTEEYDIHSLYGHMSINATYQGLLNVFEGKRPFIIARSTFPGSGTMAGHWGGDNTSLWAYMLFSIPQALSFSLFGIPMFGVDTCGFNGNSDEELCNRWMQLSAFFPFYRNHNVLSAISQEPYVWSSVIDASKSAMEIRYALLPYMYTLFYLSHTTGSTVMRALSWEFPNDPTLANADLQFLLGPSLMIIPVLEPQVDTVDGVFPGIAQGEVWYDWYTQTAVQAAAGVNTTIDAPLGHIPVYVRGGSVLPMQEPAMTTRDARNTPWSLLASLDKEGEASGQLYVDDGESIHPEETLNVDFSVTESTLTASSCGTFSEDNPLSRVTVLGVADKPSSVTFNDVKLPGSSVSYNETSHVLSICELEKATSDGAWSNDWVLKWV